MLNFLSIFLLTYGVLAISHIAFQIILCHSDHRRQSKKSFKDFHSNYQASVSVIVPAYNEEPQILKNCIDSIVAQKAPDLEIIVVDDGSKNRENLDLILLRAILLSQWIQIPYYMMRMQLKN